MYTCHILLLILATIGIVGGILVAVLDSPGEGLCLFLICLCCSAFPLIESSYPHLQGLPERVPYVTVFTPTAAIVEWTVDGKTYRREYTDVATVRALEAKLVKPYWVRIWDAWGNEGGYMEVR